MTLDEGHGAVATAVLHVSSLGIFEAFVDGVPVADDVLSPGWSSYEWRLRYRSYDVTALLRDAHSVLGVRARATAGTAAGWAGTVRRDSTATGSALIAQLEITFADGHRQVVVTDETWSAGAVGDAGRRPLRRPDHRRAAARRRVAAPGADATGWVGVEAVEFDLARLAPYVGPPVRPPGEPPPGARSGRSPSGRTLVDFGQNLVGWLRFTVRGEPGRTITVRHAEVLEHGELGVRPLAHPRRRPTGSSSAAATTSSSRP